MSAQRAYSDHDRYSPDRYSDDFVSDEDKRTPTPRRGLTTPKRSAHHQYYQDRFRGGRGRGAGARGRGRGRGTKKGRGNSRNSEPADMRRSHDTVTTRVLSASRNRINELRNQVEELKILIRDLEQENKLYKKMQFRQEKAIRTFEDKENDLPRILDKHNNEVRSLREQNRRLKEKYDKSDRYLRDAEDELERVKKKMNKYKEMCEQKELLERDELSRKLTKAEIDMEEKDVKIKELQRHIEVLKKNHRHELGIEVARQKEMKKQVEESSEKNSQLENQLKEKEKALEYQNIYSQNRGRPSRDNSPDGSPSRRPKKKASSMTELTPRDKAKFYAEKRRVELLKQKELKAEQEKKKKQKYEAEEREKEAREKEEREREREERERKEHEREKEKTPPEFSFKSIDRGLEEREERARREEEDRKWRERDEKEKREREEMQRKQKELERRRDQENTDRRDREEGERREREQRERKEREERERREREEREREEKDRLERERRERERIEQERRAQLEKQRLDNDPKILEERRKKDELLRKLQAMDEIGSAGTDPFTPGSPSRKSKEQSFDTQSRRSEPKEYSFTKPINNLHQGKPSHEDIHVPYIDRQRHGKRQSADDDLGGYQPSFVPSKGGGTSKPPPSTKPLSIFDDDEPAFKITNKTSPNTATTKTDKKSTDLLENLFGPQANSTKNMSTKRVEENETFFVTSKSPSSNTRTLNNTSAANSTTNFPWDSSPTKVNRSTFDSEKTTTIFGGGAALLDDDHTTSGSKVLPRRQRQQNINTFSSKPSVSAVDTFDDEIEEVVL